jgi:hypothetical protein
MREGTLNRVLYGDPTFRPFAAVSPHKGSLRVARAGDTPKDDAATFTVAVERPQSFEYRNPYSGAAETGERLVAALPLAAGELGVAGVTLQFAGQARPKVTRASWTLDTRRAAPPVLWVMLEAPATGKYDVKELWRTDVTYRFDVRCAATAAATGDVVIGE